MNIAVIPVSVVGDDFHTAMWPVIEVFLASDNDEMIEYALLAEQDWTHGQTWFIE